MLARLRKAQEEGEGGFTLIELLVVIIIIGILAAIAIPVFLNQRKKAVDASIKSDLRTVANEMETYYVDSQYYPAVTSNTATVNTIGVGSDTVTLSKGNVVSVQRNGLTNTSTAFCIQITNSNGTTPATGFFYASNAGGVQPSGTTACPAAPTGTTWQTAGS